MIHAHQTEGKLWHTMRIVCMDKPLLLIVISCFGFCVLISLLLMLNTPVVDLPEAENFNSRKVMYIDLDSQKEQVQALEAQINELENIKIKALNELRRLDKLRVQLLHDISNNTHVNEILLKEKRSHTRKLQTARKELDNLLVQSNQVRQQEIVRNVIHIDVPKQITFDRTPQTLNVRSDNNTKTNGCTFHSCFNYSRCSTIRSFRYYVHEPSGKRNRVTLQLQSLLESFDERTTRLEEACSFLHLVEIHSEHDFSGIMNRMFQLPLWNRGTNHVVFILSDKPSEVCNFLTRFDKTHAVFISHTFCTSSHRTHFDFLLPSFRNLQTESINLWTKLPPLVPVKRKYLVSFMGKWKKLSDNSLCHITEQDLHDLSRTDSVYIETSCSGDPTQNQIGWVPCSGSQQKIDLLRTSTFTIVIADCVNYFLLQDVIDTLYHGSIPIVIGTIPLPLADVIDWKQVAIFNSIFRLPELVYTVQTMPSDDIFSMRLQGRFVYETYFSSQKNTFRTFLSAFQYRIGLPPSLIRPFYPKNLNDRTSIHQNLENYHPLKSPQLVHNHSYVGKDARTIWNTFPGAHYMYPSRPAIQSLPNLSQFLSEEKGRYSPIANGRGGDGVPFSRSLGGDFPVEQFTVVMLTYDRNAILMDSLQRLAGMKYMHKIIVVWNHPVDPGRDLVWPDVGVPLEVVRGEQNSLNNRLLPFDNIETDAVLSMDDDIYLRHDEIEVAFRVWRENRERLVGFPGRHHAYNASSQNFMYDSQHACELSLVLTGGAFFHKFYTYLYTYYVPQSIKQYVNAYMNCEDIAMNFLIAHITQKPPIKVTSRWTFRCPGCPNALSGDETHYRERSDCIAQFSKIFGYNPLKRTQFRADSILFKTKLPVGATKCFQFV